MNYVYTGFDIQNGSIVRLDTCALLYIGGDAVILDNNTLGQTTSTYGILIGMSIRYCAGISVLLKNSLSLPTPTTLLMQTSRLYGENGNISNILLRAQDYSTANITDSSFLYANSGITAHDLSQINMQGCIFQSIVGLNFDQSDSTTILNIFNTTGDFSTPKMNITNPDNIKLVGLDNNGIIVGNGTDDTYNRIFTINTGDDLNNPTFAYGRLFNEDGINYENGNINESSSNILCKFIN